MTTMTISARWLCKNLIWEMGADFGRRFGNGIVTIQYPGEKPEVIPFKKDMEEGEFLQETLTIKQEAINKAEKQGYSARADQIGLFFNGKLETLVMQKK